MSSSGNLLERRQAVADVTSRIFGKPVDPERVIGETLQRVTPAGDAGDRAWVARLVASVDAYADVARLPYAEFIRDPLCSWIETSVGVTTDTEPGNLVRAIPRRIGGEDGLAPDLATLKGRDESACADALRSLLLAGFEKADPDPSGTRAPAFAFRLHQFLSRGEAVFASLDLPHDRYVTLKALQRVPGRQIPTTAFPVSPPN